MTAWPWAHERPCRSYLTARRGNAGYACPLLGCDGLPKTGQAWVKRGLLAATIFVGPNTGQALDMLVQALQTGTVPRENTLTAPLSIPPLDVLAAGQAEKARLLSV